VPVQPFDDGPKRLIPPLTDADVEAFDAGDVVLVKGTVIGARDAAHKRLVEMLERGEELPFDPRGAVIYYVGPTPERPGNPIGAAGPTTAGRMDRYTPALLEQGVKAMIGKGGRGPAIRAELQRHTAVSLAALGGGGALAARAITRQRIIAFEDLGPEAIREIEMDDFPVWVVNDCRGRDYYAETILPWRKDELLPVELRAAGREIGPSQERGELGGG
jgi:fumarate hydratase subunit beta